jgi:hypothetical protein
MLHRRFLLAAAFAGVPFAIAIGQPGCASNTTAATSGAVSTTSAGGAGGSSGNIVQASSSSSAGGAAATGGAGGAGGMGECGAFDGAVLAVDKLYLGSTTFTGEKKDDAWKEFGFNVDGLTTTNDFSAHCKPYSDGKTSSFEDGIDGRDNSFGRNVRPAIEALSPDLDSQANNAIAAGSFTQIFAFEKLGTSPDAGPLITKVYGGAQLGMAPAWKGNDCWPVVYEDLKNGKDISSAKSVYLDAKLVKNVWESNGKTDVVLPLTVLNQTVPLRLYQVRMSVKLDPTHKGGALGQLGGFVKTEEFVKAVRTAAGSISKQYCQLFDLNLADTIRRSSDMLDDGSQDPNKTCNAISVGIGFTLRSVAFGKIAPPAQPVVDPCQ